MAMKKHLVLLGLVGMAAAAGTTFCLPGCRSGAEDRGARSPDSASPAAVASPLPRTGVVTGRLVRGCGTNPVEGRVSVAVPGGAPRAAATGGGGAFRVEGLPGAAPLTLAATSEGLLPAVYTGFHVRAGESLDLGDLELGSGTRVEVLVTDVSARPAAGAVVTLLRRPFEEPYYHFDASRTLSPPGPPPPAEASGTTDAGGRVVFDRVPPGSWILRADGAGCAPMARTLSFREGERPEATLLRLLPSRSLTGTVRMRDGRAAAGIEVQVELPGSDSLHDLGVLRTLTGPDGRYRVDGLPATTLTVLVRAAPSSVRRVAEVLDPDIGDVDIVLGDSVPFRGRVVDAATREPIAGADVEVEAFGDGPPRNSECARTTSGADGGFSLDFLPTAGLSELVVRKEGYLPFDFRNLPREGGAPPLATVERVFPLARGGTIRGRVTDARGRPILGAVVQPLLLRSEEDRERRSWWWEEKADLARTAADGSFWIPGCPPGRHLLVVRAPGWVQPELPSPRPDAFSAGDLPPSLLIDVPAGGEVERDLVLGRGATVEGTVKDTEGHPLAGYAVALTAKGDYEPASAGPLTDAEGRFRIEGAPALAEATVRAEGRRWSRGISKPFPIATRADVKGVEIVVGPRAGIAGTLRREDGVPVVDARIASSWSSFGPELTTSWNWGALGDETSTCFPAEDGSFEIPVPGPGQFAVFVLAKGFAPVLVPTVTVERGEMKRGLDLVLHPGMALGGRVVDAAGAPVRGAGIGLKESPRYIESEGVLRAVTGEDGRFLIRDLPPDLVVLFARSPGRPEVRREAEPGSTDAVMTQEAGTRIAGTVVDSASGKGVPGIPVKVEEPDAYEGGTLGQEYRVHETKTDGEGRFSVEELAPHLHSISVGERGDWKGPESEYAPAKVEDVAAGTVDLRIPLSRGLVIAGRLVGKDGSPPAGDVQVTLYPLGPEYRGGPFPRIVGRDGSFRVPGLEAGDYRIEFSEQESSDGRRRMAPPFPATGIASVAAGTEDFVVQVGSGSYIEGRVVDSHGKPAGGNGELHIHLSGSRADRYSGWDFAYAEKDGTFRTSALLPGRKYDISASGFEGLIEGTAKGIASGTMGVVITLQDGGSLSGRILLPDGSPAPARIPVRIDATGLVPPGTEGTSALKWTDNDGTFRVSGLADYEFSVVAGGGDSTYAPTPAPGTYRPGAGPIEVRLEPAVTVKGTLVGVDGKPVHAASVTASQEGPRKDFAVGAVAADGAFELRGLRRGKVRIWAYLDSGQRYLGEFDAPAKDLSITVKPE